MLLQTTDSWPVNQQHQLAYVGHLLADPKSHTKINFFSGNKATKCMTAHATIINFVNPNYCVLQEDSTQITPWDVMVSGEMIHSVPRGNDKSDTSSQGG